VGTTQFVGCAIGGISVGEVMKTILPFYAALIAALFLVTYVPAFSHVAAAAPAPLTASRAAP
jgi:TRAP-type C4-dicarboxylate transport system permease large subunit